MSLLRGFPGATATPEGEALVRCPEFSSLRDLPAPRWGEGARQAGLLRGAVGNTTPAGKPLTHLHKRVTGGGSGGRCSKSRSSI